MLEEYETIKKTEIEVETVYQVRKAYFSFLVAQAAKRFSNRLFHEVKTLRRMMKKLKEKSQDDNTPALSELDLMEIDTFLLRTKSLKIKTDQMERTALHYLSFTSGIKEPLSPKQISGGLKLDFALPPKKDYLQKGLTENPMLASIESGVQAHDYLYRAEKAARWPAIGLRGFYEKLGHNTVFKPDDYYGASLVIKGPLFDFGETTAKANQHLFKKNELSNKKRIARKYIETTITALYDDITGLRDQLKIDQEEMEIHDRRLKLALFGMKNGLVSYREYKEAFITRNLLKKEYFEKLADYYDKVNTLIKTVGDKNI